MDVTVSVAINGRTLGDLTTNTLMELVGNAVGIAPEDRTDKIAIANAPFYEDKEADKRSTMEVITEAIKDNLLFVIIGVIVLLLLLAALFIVLRKRKKKQEEAEEEMLEETLTELPEGEGIEEGAETEEEEELLTPELLNIQNERSQELRERVRAFAEENPELSAQMLKNWLRGGDEDGNGCKCNADAGTKSGGGSNCAWD